MQIKTRNILAGALLVTLPTFAFACDGHTGTPPMKGGMQPPAHMMGEKPPRDMNTLSSQLAELDRLQELDLSDVQQKKIFDIVYEQALTIFENDQIARQTKRELHQLTMSDKFDAAKAKSLADEHSKAMSTLIYMRAETESRVWAILTEPQRKRLVERMGPRPRQ